MFAANTMFRHAGRRIGSAIVLCVALCAVPGLYGAPGDTSADVVLGQSDLVSNDPNRPLGLPRVDNLGPNNAAHVVIAPGGRVYVSDAGNHRVLSWANASALVHGQPADLVIGQPNFTSGTPNNGGVSASSLSLPQGLAVDEVGNLWVADAFNSRVLMFLAPPTHDVLADLVIGQPDFTQNRQNLGNGDHGTNVALPDGLQFPGRVLVRGQDVYVADSGNSRVLHYTYPFANKPFADAVFGQFGDFTKRAKNNDGAGNGGCCASADNLYNPIGIALDSGGSLYVADWNNHRILRFDDPLSTDTTADAVLGQSGLNTNAPNQGGLAHGFWLPTDLSIDPHGRLYVADAANNRVLVHRNPYASPIVPNDVFGQLDVFTTNAENHGLGVFATDADGLFGPTGIAIDALLNVYVMDTNNSRVLRFDVPIPTPLVGDVDEDGVVDLVDFASIHPCLTGPGGGPAQFECAVADLNGNGDVDLTDLALFQNGIGAEIGP
jgi:sugar lactone lactonase YvrE